MIAEDGDPLTAQAALDEQMTGYGFDLERVEETYDSLLVAARATT